MKKSKNEYCVYKHTTPSGKVYIGITKQSPLKRWKNGLGYEGCTAFNRAIKKYGWDQISHEVLAENIDKESACKLEQYYISTFDSSNPQNGYNLTLGGEHYTKSEELKKRESEIHKQVYIDHPELRDHISEIQRGRKASDSTRAKMSESRKKYIQQHPETRERCRKTFSGMKRSDSNREKLRIANQEKVRCIETGEVFNSVADAAKAVGVCRSSISNNLIGRSKSCGGRHFEYMRCKYDDEGNQSI